MDAPSVPSAESRLSIAVSSTPIAVVVSAALARVAAEPPVA